MTPLLRISEPIEQIKNNRARRFVNGKSCDTHCATRKERNKNTAFLCKIAPSKLRMFDAWGRHSQLGLL
jgi:hypothetical protein